MASAARILLVEDDRDSLDAWTEALRHAGYWVTGATSFEDARRALHATPDLLITDVRLGAYNGLQLVIRGRALNPHLMVIVMTGYPDASLRQEAERFGAVHLEKPVDLTRLLRLIEAMLHGTGPTMRR